MNVCEILLFGILLHRARATQEDYFKVSPTDVELKGDGSPVRINCEMTSSVEKCQWLRGGNELQLEHGKYEIEGDLSLGQCNLHIVQPQVGIDTTFWQCNPMLTNYDRLLSNPARVVVKNGTGNWNSAPYSLRFGVTRGDNSQKRKITLDGKLGATTRVRWFINGKLTPAINTDLSDKHDKFSHVRSSLAVTSFPKSDPLMIHCCVEVQSDALLKTVFVGAIYVIDDNYDVETSKPLKTLPYTIIPPNLRLTWTYYDSTVNINDNRVILRTKTFDKNKISVRCTDDAATPTTYLRWGLIDPNGDTDVTDRNVEFDDNAISGPEAIEVDVQFLYPNRYITLQCQAGDVVHAGIIRSVSAKITVREEDACFGFVAKNQKSGGSIINFYSTLMVISLSMFCHLSPF